VRIEKDEFSVDVILSSLFKVSNFTEKQYKAKSLDAGANIGDANIEDILNISIKREYIRTHGFAFLYKSLCIDRVVQYGIFIYPM
jgi:hypothetical protein